MIKGLLKMTVLFNCLTVPIYILFLVDIGKKQVYRNEYKLTEARIKTVEYDTDEGHTTIAVDYCILKDTATTGRVDFSLGSKEYLHFSDQKEKGIVWEVFGTKTPADVGDVIWVWHNDHAVDFYALGKKDTFNRIAAQLNRDFIIFSLLLILGVISIYKFHSIMRYLT